MTKDPSPRDLLALSSQVLKSYILKNKMQMADVPALIDDVYRTLSQLLENGANVGSPQPAVPIEHSVTKNYIICLEDGRKLKILKRHLMTTYGLTPRQYRVKWGLRPDYPMVAPGLAARRRELGQRISLSRWHGSSEPGAAAVLNGKRAVA